MDLSFYPLTPCVFFSMKLQIFLFYAKLVAFKCRPIWFIRLASCNKHIDLLQMPSSKSSFKSVSIKIQPTLELYILHSTLYTLHSTLHTLHSTLYTLHSTLYNLHSKIYTLHSTNLILQPSSFSIKILLPEIS